MSKPILLSRTVADVWHHLVVVSVPHAMGDIATPFRSLTESTMRAREAITAFHDALWYEASQSYLQHHRRLPGSEGTVRLRKKRYARVWAWWFLLPDEPGRPRARQRKEL
jgi:hypothetical protein